ncbi:uncharacterized protein VSU04_012359 [Chlamydotis macqueenii]
MAAGPPLATPPPLATACPPTRKRKRALAAVGATSRQPKEGGAQAVPADGRAGAQPDRVWAPPPPQCKGPAPPYATVLTRTRGAGARGQGSRGGRGTREPFPWGWRWRCQARGRGSRWGRVSPGGTRPRPPQPSTGRTGSPVESRLSSIRLRCHGLHLRETKAAAAWGSPSSGLAPIGGLGLSPAGGGLGLSSTPRPTSAPPGQPGSAGPGPGSLHLALTPGPAFRDIRTTLSVHPPLPKDPGSSGPERGFGGLGMGVRGCSPPGHAVNSCKGPRGTRQEEGTRQGLPLHVAPAPQQSHFSPYGRNGVPAGWGSSSPPAALYTCPVCCPSA